MGSKFFGAVAVAALSGSAYAGMQFVGIVAGQNVDITFNSVDSTVFAGKLLFLETTTNVNFETFCADLSNHISGGQTWNYNPILASTINPNYGAAGSVCGGAFALPTNNGEFAALQTAIWEAVYDYSGSTTPDFSNGVFQLRNADSNFLSKANSYYSLVNDGNPAIYFQPDPTNAGQGQMAPVPEPATMTALAIGVGALLKRRRK